MALNIFDINTENARLCEDIARLHENIACLDAENAHLSAENARLDEQISDLYKKNTDLYEKNTDLYEKNTDLYEKNTCLTGQVQKLNKEVAENPNKSSVAEFPPRGHKVKVSFFLLIWKTDSTPSIRFYFSDRSADCRFCGHVRNDIWCWSYGFFGHFNRGIDV
jgi:cell division protein FtsB